MKSFQWFSLLIRAVHWLTWSFGAKGSVLFSNCFNGTCCMCLLLFFAQPSGGSLGDHHPSGVSCPHVPRAPGVWGWLLVPPRRGCCPRTLCWCRMQREGTNLLQCLTPLWAWQAKVRQPKKLNILDFQFWNKAFEPKISELQGVWTLWWICPWE